jgi:hypothetical protein
VLAALAMLVADRGRGRRAARPRRARRAGRHLDLDVLAALVTIALVAAPLDLDVLAALVAIALVAAVAIALVAAVVAEHVTRAPAVALHAPRH